MACMHVRDSSKAAAQDWEGAERGIVLEDVTEALVINGKILD